MKVKFLIKSLRVLTENLAEKQKINLSFFSNKTFNLSDNLKTEFAIIL